MNEKKTFLSVFSRKNTYVKVVILTAIVFLAVYVDIFAGGLLNEGHTGWHATVLSLGLVGSFLIFDSHRKPNESLLFLTRYSIFPMWKRKECRIWK